MLKLLFMSICVSAVCCWQPSFAQHQRIQPLLSHDSTEQELLRNAADHNEITIPTTFNSGDSGFVLIRHNPYSCKGSPFICFSYVNQSPQKDTIKKVTALPMIAPKPRVKLLQIHGTVAYDFMYRSRVDTPVNQQDLQQHTERVTLNIIYKEKYPFRVSFILRQSNSPFFSNFADLGLQFDQSAFKRDLRKSLADKIAGRLPSSIDLLNLQTSLHEKIQLQEKIKSWLRSPSTLQMIIEEREQEYYKKLYPPAPAAIKDSLSRIVLQDNQLVADPLHARLPGRFNWNRMADSMAGLHSPIPAGTGQKADSIHQRITAYRETAGQWRDSLQNKAGEWLKSGKDNAINKYADLYSSKQKELDSLNAQIATLRKRVDSMKRFAQKDIQKLRSEINTYSSTHTYKKLAAAYGVNYDSIAGKDSRLAAFRTLGLGRSVLNYSELTARNITITGLNVEYNASRYMAFAAGKIDYRFRDFLGRNNNRGGQYLVLGRYGWGDIDRRALIFSIYLGRKSQTNFALPDSVAGHVGILGYAAELIWRKDAFNGISIEVAKSTKPMIGNAPVNKAQKDLWNFTDRSNMGFHVQGNLRMALTNTQFSGFYRRTGQHFQSFSLFSYQTDQSAWQIRADQELFRNRVTFTGMLRRNDFSNPFTVQTFKTSTIFKTFLLNVRFPKLPAISIGYYPGTQLYVVNQDLIRENAYYILNGSMVYAYRVADLRMHSSVVYNRFFNQASDSGFIYFRGINYYLSQTLLLRKLQLQAGYAFTEQPGLRFYTLETSAEYGLNARFRTGAGLKYNRLASGDTYIGKRLMVSADLKRLGVLLAQYERSYLPATGNKLYPVEIGRLSWFKTF